MLLSFGPGKFGSFIFISEKIQSSTNNILQNIKLCKLSLSQKRQIIDPPEHFVVGSIVFHGDGFS